MRAAYIAACSAAAAIAFQERCANRVQLHHLAYYVLRKRFPDLGAQMACKAIRAAAHGVRSQRASGGDWKLLKFARDASVQYDARTFRLIGDKVSAFTMHGRQSITLRIASFQRRYLALGSVGEADLVHRRKQWYLHITLNVPETDYKESKNVLGVDLGENVIAALSSGVLFGGGQLRDTRDRFAAFRRRLQGNGSQSAKQLLARVSETFALASKQIDGCVRDCIDGLGVNCSGSFSTKLKTLEWRLST